VAILESRVIDQSRNAKRPGCCVRAVGALMGGVDGTRNVPTRRYQRYSTPALMPWAQKSVVWNFGAG
jgi:hypothetical protein